MAEECAAAGARFEMALRAAVRVERSARGRGTAAADGAVGGVCSVVGCGLMLGLRFDRQVLARLAAAVTARRPGACDGVPPVLLLYSYVLAKHGVRTRPTAGALMLDLPAVASDASVRRVCDAARALVALLATEAFDEVISAWSVDR